MTACIQRGTRCALAAALAAACALVVRPIAAQDSILASPAAVRTVQEEVAAPPGVPVPPLVEPGLLSDPWPALECESCGGLPCSPGRTPCHACEGHTAVGRFLCAIYQSICCPDPCYDPHWLAVADSAFFTPAARPQSQQRFRWDAGRNVIFPDRAEYFWARADGSGLGPRPTAPLLGEPRVDYNELSLYTEAAVGNLGVIVELPYREVEPEVASHASGFADMSVGTKTLLFDRELFQIAFQFKTYIPQGDPLEGLGVGHVSLEPSLIVALNIGPKTYLQAQLAEWIPLGGNPDYQGAILHHHLSLNHIVYRFLPDVPLIASLEYGGWSFQTGQYTDPLLGTQPASDETYVSLGGGLRLVICDKLDFGVGIASSMTDAHFAEQLYRTEFRWRY
jgi:hypothetical protein